MGYDFFVFPAGDADDVEAATRLYETASGRGTPTPGGAMAGFLADVAEEGLEARGHDAGAEVHGSWADPRRDLARVAGAARAHGLSVLDVQLTVLYDPRGAVDVPLETEAGPCLPFVTPRLLHDVVGHLAERRYGWARVGDARLVVDGPDLRLDGEVVAPARAAALLWSRVATGT